MLQLFKGIDPADSVCTAAMYFTRRSLRHACSVWGVTYVWTHAIATLPGTFSPDETEFQSNNNQFRGIPCSTIDSFLIGQHFKPPLLNSCWNTKLPQLDKMQSRIPSCQNPFYVVYPLRFKMRTCCTYRFLQIPINNISVMLFLCPGKLLEGFTHTHKKYVQAYKSITILDVCFFSLLFPSRSSLNATSCKMLTFF